MGNKDLAYSKNENALKPNLIAWERKEEKLKTFNFQNSVTGKINCCGGLLAVFENRN